MKNLALVISFISFLIVFTPCCKKKVDSNTTNYISLNGKIHYLDNGFIEADGNGIHIISSGINFSPQLDYIEHTGTGNLIFLSDYAENEDLSPKVGTISLNTLRGGIGINFNFATEVNDYSLDFRTLSTGTCIISKIDNKYEIIISYTDNNKNEVKGYYSGELTKIIQLPILTTSDISNITQTTATCGGNITFDGGATITSHGVCWSTTNNPTISLNTKTTDGEGTGAFISSMTGLTIGTYYVRAYATNKAGTAYGNEVTFTIMSFKNDIQPIFSSNCINCHGGIKTPDLSLGKAFASLTSLGYLNTVDPDLNLLYLKINSIGHSVRTTVQEKQKMHDWIKQGALNN